MNDHTVRALTRSCRRALSRARPVAMLATGVALSGYVALAEATTINVTTTEQKVSSADGCSLQEAIWAANLNNNRAIVVGAGNSTNFIDTECVLENDGKPANTIILPDNATFTMDHVVDDPFNYVGPTATPMVLADIVIEGNGSVIQHAPNLVPFRAFAVGTASFATGQVLVAGRGNLTLRNAQVRGFVVKGGDGAYGGGGGLGAGGAVYVHGGALTVENSTFNLNSVIGGNGSRNVLNTGGGGGGGLGGSGARAGLAPQDPEGGGDQGGGGGGGGGARGDGGRGWSNCGSPCLGIGAEGGGGGGTVGPGDHADVVNGTVHGGFRCGGRGGHVDLNPLDSLQDGEDGTCPGGGGGGGRDSLYAADLLQEGGDGGRGDYGGGGGGGAGLLTAGHGGHGGFGGGGGAAYPDHNPPPYLCSPDGGDGGFGAGGGAGPGGVLGDGCVFYTGPGRGGSFAGNAGPRDGGGGAGLGGAIFMHSGTVLVKNSTFTANGAARGVAGSWPNNEELAHSGQDQGAAIFAVGGSLTVLNSTIAGNEGTSSNNGGAGIVVYAPGYDIFSPFPGVPATRFELRNTIIAGNYAGSQLVKECRLINSSGNSVTFVGSGNLITANDNCSAGLVSNADPLLAGLQLNPPGLTPTMALGDGSPAIDTADANTATAADQRGVPRTVGAGPDIGAYEWGSVVAKCKDVVVAAGASCQANASIDDGSFAPDGGSFEVNEEPPGPYNLGDTVVTLTATHESGMEDSCEATVTVSDNAPPVIVATTVRSALSPMKKHDLVNVGIGASAEDECSTPPTSFRVAVFGDEDDETPTDGTTTVFSPDASDIAINSLRLRAERMDSSDGRVYLMVVSGEDGSGNTGTGCTAVVVPHNTSAASARLVAGQATNALAYCESHAGAAPAGYFVIGDGPAIGPKPKK